MYIAVLEDFPAYMTPTLVAHAVIQHDVQKYANWDSLCGYTPTHYEFLYEDWITNSFKKVVLRVNQKQFDKISQLPNVTLSHENNTLNGKKACAVVVVDDTIPNVLKFAKLWEPVRIAGD